MQNLSFVIIPLKTAPIMSAMSPSRKTARVFAPLTRHSFWPLVAIWRSPCCIAWASPRFPPPDVPFPIILSRLLPCSVPQEASNNSQALPYNNPYGDAQSNIEYNDNRIIKSQHCARTRDNLKQHEIVIISLTYI